MRKSYNDMYTNETVIQRNKVLSFHFGSVYVCALRLELYTKAHFVALTMQTVKLLFTFSFVCLNWRVFALFRKRVVPDYLEPLYF